MPFDLIFDFRSLFFFSLRSVFILYSCLYWLVGWHGQNEWRMRIHNSMNTRIITTSYCKKNNPESIAWYILSIYPALPYQNYTYPCICICICILGAIHGSSNQPTNQPIHTSCTIDFPPTCLNTIHINPQNHPTPTPVNKPAPEPTHSPAPSLAPRHP